MDDPIGNADVDPVARLRDKTLMLQYPERERIAAEIERLRAECKDLHETIDQLDAGLKRTSADNRQLRASAKQDDRLRVVCLTLRDEARQSEKRLRAALARVADITRAGGNSHDAFRIAWDALSGNDEQALCVRPSTTP